MLLEIYLSEGCSITSITISVTTVTAGIESLLLLSLLNISLNVCRSRPIAFISPSRRKLCYRSFAILAGVSPKTEGRRHAGDLNARRFP